MARSRVICLVAGSIASPGGKIPCGLAGEVMIVFGKESGTAASYLRSPSLPRRRSRGRRIKGNNG